MMDNPNYAAAETLFLRALGEASMCWNPRPSSETFNPDEALGICKRELPKIMRLIEAGFSIAVANQFRKSADELDALAVELRKRERLDQ
jgi:hypothetical protein